MWLEEIEARVVDMGEKRPSGVTLTITASGDVGDGKSKALKIALDALSKHPELTMTRIKQYSMGRAETASLQLIVKEPWDV